MLSALLLRLALDVEPVPNENEESTPSEEVDPSQYDKCTLGVLMDWEGEKAKGLVFQVKLDGQVDLETATPLVFQAEQHEDVIMEWAEVPFDVSPKALIPSYEWKVVLGMVIDATTDTGVLLPPSHVEPEPVTISGLTGRMVTIHDPYGCKLDTEPESEPQG